MHSLNFDSIYVVDLQNIDRRLELSVFGDIPTTVYDYELQNADYHYGVNHYRHTTCTTTLTYPTHR